MLLCSTCVHVCLPDGISYDAVHSPHLKITCETGQVGTQSLTEPLSFLPRALPAQPFLVKHLTRLKNNLQLLLKHIQYSNTLNCKGDPIQLLSDQVRQFPFNSHYNHYYPCQITA